MIQPACHIQRVSLKASLPAAASPQQKVIAPRGTTRLNTRFPNYAKVLGAHDYLTAHYGKWPLGAAPYSPREHGFDVDVPNNPSHGPKGSYFGPKNTVKALAYKPGSIWKTTWPMKRFALFTSTRTAPFYSTTGPFLSIHPTLPRKPYCKNTAPRRASPYLA